MQTNDRSPSRKKKKTEDLPTQALALATKLKDSMLTNTPGTIAPTVPALRQWAADVEKLHRLDGKTWEQIEWLLAWSQHDPFWRANILSGAKFRQKWNQLLAQASKEQPKLSAPLTDEEIAQGTEWSRLKERDRHGH